MRNDNYHNDYDLVPRGYRINPDWNRNFREDQDKITKIFDEILDMTAREYTKKNNTMLLEVYFTKYYNSNQYCLVYRMKEDYAKLTILINAILDVTDEILDWYDITTFINFNVYIITPDKTYRLTYLDLLYECITMDDNYLGKPNHPRYDLMVHWIYYHRNYERITNKRGNYDPYRYRDVDDKIKSILYVRNDRNPKVPNYRPDELISRVGDGIQRGYYNYVRGGDFFYQQEQQRQQQMSELYERRSEPIVESDGFITRMRKKLKI